MSERFMLIVGFADGREPFRLLSRISVDTGYDDMPALPTDAEMQPIAYAAKMAFGKVMRARKKRAK